ncbi:MAG: hypothetical protein JNL11_03750 [Bdellovibrionaceae bacterium]|nr:hypothetical protein [Pseudobdellovibrionaceae bacterium]
MFKVTQSTQSIKILRSLVIGTLLATSLSAGTALAQRVSGGGNIKYCQMNEGQPPKIELLDYYDATRNGGYGFEIDLGPKKTNEEKIAYVLDRLEKIDPFRANLYRKYAADFEKDMTISDSQSWGTTSNDLGSGYFLEDGCSIRRLAVLRSEQEVFLSNDRKVYEISGLWKTLDETTKAGIKLHEIAYREGVSRGANDSLRIRRYVALISSKQILTADYRYEILKSGLVFWGLPVQNFESFDTTFRIHNQYPANFTENFPPATHWAEFDGTSFTFGSLIEQNKTNLYLDSLKYQCRNFKITDLSNIQRNSIFALDRMYSAFLKSGSISFSNFPEQFSISLSGCGDIRVSSQQFTDYKFKFDMVLDSNQKTYLSNGHIVSGFTDVLISKKFGIRGVVKQGYIESFPVVGRNCSIFQSNRHTKDSVLCMGEKTYYLE